RARVRHAATRCPRARAQSAHVTMPATTTSATTIHIQAVLPPLSVAATVSVAVGDGVSRGVVSRGLGEQLSVRLGSVVARAVVGSSDDGSSVGFGDGVRVLVGLGLGLSVSSDSLGIGAAVSVGDSVAGSCVGFGLPEAIEDAAALSLALPSSVHDDAN